MNGSYRRLGTAIAINTVLMFLITYAMIDRPEHFYPNVNRAYMALMMAAPMVLIMLLVMRQMYSSVRLNLILVAAALIVFAGAFGGARTQTPIGNDQFLRSMIPHHSSAILMCERAAITDRRIVSLCEEIVAAQEREITEMKRILADR